MLSLIETFNAPLESQAQGTSLINEHNCVKPEGLSRG